LKNPVNGLTYPCPLPTIGQDHYSLRKRIHPKRNRFNGISGGGELFKIESVIMPGTSPSLN